MYSISGNYQIVQLFPIDFSSWSEKEVYDNLETVNINELTRQGWFEQNDVSWLLENLSRLVLFPAFVRSIHLEWKQEIEAYLKTKAYSSNEKWLQVFHGSLFDLPLPQTLALISHELGSSLIGTYQETAPNLGCNLLWQHRLLNRKTFKQFLLANLGQKRITRINQFLKEYFA